jgi:chemotaxis protein MotB
MADAETSQLTFIKRVKKHPHGGHHGGQWKVAYADFVTAMMAFFLMLWLLNATTEEQKTAVADYFAPAAISKTKSGAGGVLAGRVMADAGVRSSQSANPRIVISIPVPSPESEMAEEETAAKKLNLSTTGAAEIAGERAGEGNSAQESADAERFSPEQQEGQAAEEPTDPAELLAAIEEREFEEAEQELREALEDTSELQEFKDNILIDRTPDGLRVQLIDQDEREMFPLGSFEMYDHTKKLLAQITQVIGRLPNPITVSGHTDATPYRTDTGYGNWELSTDRANASRRELIRAGLPEERIVTVAGKADTDLLFPDDPTSPSNRRISITLLRAEPGDEPPADPITTRDLIERLDAAAPPAESAPETADEAPSGPSLTPAEMLDNVFPYGG